MKEYNYEDVQRMIYSLQKNIQEISEQLVYDFGVSNYYELIDLLIDLWNIRAKLKIKDFKLYETIINELKEEE